jgi:hypothetical protein
MSMLVANCPRCGTEKITFDLTQAKYIGIESTWQKWYEAFCVCRECRRATIFVLSQSRHEDRDLVSQEFLITYKASLNDYINIENFICIKDMGSTPPPEHLPEDVEGAFREGATCMSVGCWNAAGTMFRLCIDLATRSMLPEENTEGLNAKTRRDLGLRLPWLFNNNLLPKELEDLSSCIKEDGNDGAHAGNLIKEDAEDLLDFTYEFLERIYTEPERLRLAKERRDSRRNPTT